MRATCGVSECKNKCCIYLPVDFKRLTTLEVAGRICSITWWNGLLNKELERMWQEVAMNYLRTCLGRSTELNHEASRVSKARLRVEILNQTFPNTT